MSSLPSSSTLLEIFFDLVPPVEAGRSKKSRPPPPPSQREGEDTMTTVPHENVIYQIKEKSGPWNFYF